MIICYFNGHSIQKIALKSTKMDSSEIFLLNVLIWAFPLEKNDLLHYIIVHNFNINPLQLDITVIF